MKIVLYSFGFKHGYPEADVVLDVRFLPNPYWVAELQGGTGCDPQVALYVLNNDGGRRFLAGAEPFLRFLLEEHQRKGREQLTLAIGCTGGRHRSVAVTEHLRAYLTACTFTPEVYHRDIDKE
ncbi:RapZ C-terminal domain-containing protein [Desulfogranum mediterraneum]|uniref:RapZ C-terminal domain-containing protein n=1 Tax=Desulfogranum mediterraneum TaxID=160661 RepID=UPI0004299EED|nr:RNase adapter RapZ [Desulfogranum mediterraneum]